MHLSPLSTTVLWRTNSNIHRYYLWIPNELPKARLQFSTMYGIMCAMNQHCFFPVKYSFKNNDFKNRPNLSLLLSHPTQPPPLLSSLPLAWNELNLFTRLSHSISTPRSPFSSSDALTGAKLRKQREQQQQALQPGTNVFPLFAWTRHFLSLPSPSDYRTHVDSGNLSVTTVNTPHLTGSTALWLHVRILYEEIPSAYKCKILFMSPELFRKVTVSLSFDPWHLICAKFCFVFFLDVSKTLCSHTQTALSLSSDWSICSWAVIGQFVAMCSLVDSELINDWCWYC